MREDVSVKVQNLMGQFGETMNHPRHPHPLKLKRDEQDPFKCSGCKELGFGPRYLCTENNCLFVLHDLCFKARPIDESRTHPFLGNCEFQFLWKPPGGPNRRLCDACGRDVRGFVYHDKSRHEADLHPYCMNLHGTTFDPFNEMELTLKDKVPSECLKCKRKDLKVTTDEPLRGWSYASSSGNYCYHVSCLKKLILVNVSSSSGNNLAGVDPARSSRSLITSPPRPKRRSSRWPTSYLTVATVGLCAVIAILGYFNVASSSSSSWSSGKIRIRRVVRIKTETFNSSAPSSFDLSREPWWWQPILYIILKILNPLVIILIFLFIANRLKPDNPIPLFTTLIGVFMTLGKHLYSDNSIHHVAKC